jgi:hypothetical protein
MKPWEQQPWVDSYRLALIETNTAKMPARIDTAKSVIESRIEELGRYGDGAAERVALTDALNALRFLTQEVALLPLIVREGREAVSGKVCGCR